MALQPEFRTNPLSQEQHEANVALRRMTPGWTERAESNQRCRERAGGDSGKQLTCELCAEDAVFCKPRYLGDLCNVHYQHWLSTPHRPELRAWIDAQKSTGGVCELCGSPNAREPGRRPMCQKCLNLAMQQNAAYETLDKWIDAHKVAWCVGQEPKRTKYFEDMVADRCVVCQKEHIKGIIRFEDMPCDAGLCRACHDSHGLGQILVFVKRRFETVTGMQFMGPVYETPSLQRVSLGRKVADALLVGWTVDQQDCPRRYVAPNGSHFVTLPAGEDVRNVTAICLWGASEYARCFIEERMPGWTCKPSGAPDTDGDARSLPGSWILFTPEGTTRPYAVSYLTPATDLEMICQSILRQERDRREREEMPLDERIAEAAPPIQFDAWQTPSDEL